MSQLTTQESFLFSQNSVRQMDPKISQWIKRNAAKKRKELAMRRYRTSSSARAQRALTRVVRSHRSSNPMQIQPSVNRSMSFWRSTQFSVGINELNGFFVGVVSGISLNWGFSLGKVVGYVNGVYTYEVAVPNAAEFQALFDYYTINSVKVQMFFSNNNSSVNSPATGMPLIHIANDFDDVQENMTINSILERVGVRTVQFDAMNHNGINHWIKPKPQMVVEQTTAGTGVLTVANSGFANGTQWLDCAASNIVHNGMKIVYNNQTRNGNTDIGSLTFIFDIEFKFRGYR